MKISYDYEDLIEELKSDILEFGKKPEDDIYIVREWDRKPYKPIIDYWFEPFEEPCEKVKVKFVLEEMLEMNKIL